MITGNIHVLACEDFSATSSVAFQNQATGNITVTPTSAPHCGVNVGGTINVLACESFTATTNISYLNEAHGTLVLTPTSRPACGVALTGNLDVRACESFTVTNSFTAGDGLGGTLTAVARDRPNCGLDIGGELHILDVCKHFTATANMTATGQATGSHIITPTSAPDCGFNLQTNINVPCITASGSVTVASPLTGGIHINSSCSGVSLSGNIGLSLDLANTITVTLTMCCRRIRICANGEVEEVQMVVCCSTPNSTSCSPIKGSARSSNPKFPITMNFNNTSC
jgi:hypothetical protein